MPLLVHDPDGRLSPRHAPRFDAAAHNPFASDQLGKRDGGFKGHRPAAQLGCALEETIIEGRQMPRSFGFGALVASLLVAIQHPAAAQDWSTRPVTLIVPYAAGGLIVRSGGFHLSWTRVDMTGGDKCHGFRQVCQLL
jgi:hypothetical protein